MFLRSRGSKFVALACLSSSTTYVVLAQKGDSKKPEKAVDSCASDLADAKSQLKKTAEEADQCGQEKSGLEQQLVGLQQEANNQLGQAEATINGLNGKIKELEEASDKKSTEKADDGSAKKLEELQKKYDTLKKTADDEADASEKKQKDLERKLKETEKKAAASDKAAAESSSKSSPTADFVNQYVDLALVAKLGDLVYRNLLASKLGQVQTVVQSVAVEGFHNGKKQAVALSKTVGANLKEASTVAYAKALDTYQDVVVPQVEVAYAQGQALYKVHAAKHLDPLLIAGAKTYASLNVDKHVATAMTMAKNAGGEAYFYVGDAYVFTVDKFIPAATEFIASKNSLEDVKLFVFQPFVVSLFGEKVKLSNGVGDLVMLLVLGIGAVYFLVYQFLLKFLLWNVVLKWALYKILLQFLIRKVILSLIIGVTWKIISLVFGILIFAVKMAFCFGCCGLCFRRSKKMSSSPSSSSTRSSTSSTSSSTRSSTVAPTPSSTKKPDSSKPQPSPTSSNGSAGNKKRR